MQNIYHEVNSLDKRCYESFGLSEDLLMENAATALEIEVKKIAKDSTKVLIVCGVGNNGADGIVLSRKLYKKYDVTMLMPHEPKSQMAKLQLQRVKALGIEPTMTLQEESYDIVIDALFGTGLKRELDDSSKKLINKLNTLDAKKIACDIPSGLDVDGVVIDVCFKADVTITMGALKSSLFSDEAKEYVGLIKVANLGISRQMYEVPTDMFLLQKRDLKLPNRAKKNTNKGSFGHCAVVMGEKKGAALLCSEAAFSFGVGLVSIVTKERYKNIPNHIMSNKTVPANCTALALGMGLAEALNKKELEKLLDYEVSFLLDADIFYKEEILGFLQKKSVVLTPHPKEFSSLLKICKLANLEVSEIQKNRISLAKIFSKNYPDIVLVLKGANTIIAFKENIYLSTKATPNLSKGGSGDVLAGLIASLLAQGYSPLKAAISGVLAHSLASQNFKESSYALTPQKLIQEIACLEKR